VGIAFFGYALGRYRIVILTPTTAGNAIARTMQEGLLFLDLDGNILFTNAALCGLLKYTDDELRGRPVDVLFPEGGKPDLDLGPQGRGLPVARPVRLRTRTGETVPVMLRLGPHFDEEGDTAGFVGLALVQEGELRLAGRVRELEAQIETILHTSLFGVYAVSEGRFQFVNEKTAEMLGYPKEELVGMPIDQIIHPDDLDGVKGRIARRELGDTSDNHHVFRVVNRQGQTRQIEVHGMSVPKDGRHTVFGFAVDVTARAENEREMGRARRLSEWLLERAPVGVLVTDLEGWVTRANARACEFLGEPSAEALQGRHLADTPLGRETPLAQWFSGDPADRDEDGAPADFTACLGSGPALRVAVMPANSMFGTAHGLVALLDLAEPPAAHGGRPQSPAMEDVAEWAALVVGGMARDLEAHLGGILGYSSLARALLPGEEKVTQYVDAIMHSAQRSLEVTSRFAALRRGGGREPAPFPLLTVLEDVVRRARDRLGEHVDVGLSVPENLPSIEGDRHLLEEALFQLATVSAAPGSRGRLDFSAATFDWTGSTTGDVQDLTPGAYLSVEIRSSQGPLPIDLPASGRDSLGMRSPAQARAGMGLWFARYVIQDHRGALSVSEGPESGWACRLWLPVPGTGSERAPRGTRSAEQAQGRVMIVDDEASVREVGSELLEEMGYSVLTAQDGQAALDILQHHPGVEVVILDMVMPRLDGEHTFFRLRELDPGIRVVISSGFTEDEKVSRLLEEGAVAFVQKPYRVQTLADAVEEAMARRDST
jgi:two-component system cell cycle sensor histidine kinase/response regulator CckA